MDVNLNELYHVSTSDYVLDSLQDMCWLLMHNRRAYKICRLIYVVHKGKTSVYISTVASMSPHMCLNLYCSTNVWMMVAMYITQI